MKNKTAILIVALTCFICIQKSSIAQRNYYQGNLHFENEEYDRAISYYKDLLQIDTTATEVLEKLAYCYQQLSMYEDAMFYYSKAVDQNDYKPTSLLYYAEALLKNEYYAEAMEQYKLLLKKNRHLKHNLELKINSCRQALLWKENSTPVYIKNVKGINSKYQEAGLFIGNDCLYFSSSRFIEKSYDEVNSVNVKINHFRIYKSEFYNDLSALNEANICHFLKLEHDVDIAHPTFNKNMDVCYFSYANSYTPGNTKFYEHPISTFTEIKILSSMKEKRKWTSTKEIIVENIPNYSILHPCLSKDGTKLYFASDKSGGKGKYDIYYCKIDSEGKFSKPINLGPEINTSGQELYPSYADDSVLYFSSDGHIGMGDLDIYKATLQNDKVLTVENLKYPINSSRNDFSYVFFEDKKSGYFCSNRPGGVGEDDIYYFKYAKTKL